MTSPEPAASPELVVLLDAAANPIGTAEKSQVHTGDTPLHLAFSVFLLNGDGQLLLTRRALSKKTWPGVWTNSFCGHPGPGESFEDAIRRRGSQELGIDPADLVDISQQIPDFSYRAVDSSGIVENEVCPVYVASLAPGVDVAPQPAEVDSYAWAPCAEVITATEATPFVFSPWFTQELAHPQLRAELERRSSRNA
ncbi:isopentenyl-diphosphate Delta-isomerase [Corynebacterium uberis]|uniref:isopentenyl-diphosphate Delta-isomerase n=1 Tax=Corynebacterium TaxID=1716 RepID=UPI001D0ACCB1|nr:MULTISPECIES: isopentenyl-diphosphate Delta-isomerase [Corynebacterium]MCZ9308193.1 isopentenyl-diphosphate Delta-isomerase [Corynebacterium sp. c6VSa_13]UDL73874.1 isopentenyl-diphosphate Delta-isomerase [Corynebacterium uberis]UDL75243.1 isopentenyl-diphosphate Delta-isomerase [Corynebacterium uberis]UDL77454.1 isopentenyl-diphosphate Delta-isomerase [Corynebacterium uberis]UDL79740.1 isopentenyl-diphosphate Delta-isomerase [Corynebacterium uberis]